MDCFEPHFCNHHGFSGESYFTVSHPPSSFLLLQDETVPIHTVTTTVALFLPSAARYRLLLFFVLFLSPARPVIGAWYDEENLTVLIQNLKFLRVAPSTCMCNGNCYQQSAHSRTDTDTRPILVQSTHTQPAAVQNFSTWSANQRLTDLPLRVVSQSKFGSLHLCLDDESAVAHTNKKKT